MNGIAANYCRLSFWAFSGSAFSWHGSFGANRQPSPQTLALMQAGVPVWTVSGFVGTSPETIHRVYGHHAPDYLGEAKQALELGGRRARKRAKKGQVA